MALPTASMAIEVRPLKAAASASPSAVPVAPVPAQVETSAKGSMERMRNFSAT